MFYPDSQDSETEGNQGDIVRVDILPLSGALINRIYYSYYLFPLLIMFLLKLLWSAFIYLWKYTRKYIFMYKTFRNFFGSIL